MPLFWRIFLANGLAVLVLVGLLAFSELTLSSPPTASELGALGLGMLALLLVNAAILGTSLTPLVRLRDGLRDVDGSGKGTRVPEQGPEEVAGVAAAYNRMLDRLEEERTRSVRGVLQAQEEERARIARELHDELGQTMTFLLLRLSMATEQAPAAVRPDLESVSDGVRAGLDQLRTISRRLRPSGLSDLGIGAALQALVEDAQRLTRLPIHLTLDRGLGRDEERDLVVYRVAQEALTNIVKHAKATRIDIELRGTDGHLVLTIVDDGVGVHGPEGTGTYSMRERARLVGGSFARTGTADGGTRIVLELPRQVCDPTPTGRDRALFPTTTLFPPPAWQLPGAADADGAPPMTDAPR